MPYQQWPDWLRPALDQRFNKLAALAGKQHQIHHLRKKLDQITLQLKNELAIEQYQLILEWEDTVNYQHAVEKEWLYAEGIKDGVRLMCCVGEIAYEIAYMDKTLECHAGNNERVK